MPGGKWMRKTICFRAANAPFSSALIPTHATAASCEHTYRANSNTVDLIANGSHETSKSAGLVVSVFVVFVVGTVVVAGVVAVAVAVVVVVVVVVLLLPGAAVGACATHWMQRASWDEH
jgi:hypothetical protein